MADAHVFTVKELTRYIKTVLERERALQGLVVRGEISNCKLHTSGHLYFTLKDEVSELRCVMWRDRVMALKFRPEEGQRVLAEGTVTVYERGGQYQLSVYSLQDAGVGNLYLAFEQLKRKLEAEGLFDTARKRPLPAIPRCIALLTSPTGAALHDFITISGRRWPGRRVVLVPTPVQGPQAPAGIVHSLNLAARVPEADVIVLCRGGGSFEELNAFNDERVARAVAASPVPVVSAVGHETDFTIADFVADLRAPTPSGAAELLTPDVYGAREFLGGLHRRIFDRVRGTITLYKRDLDRLLQHPELRNPRALLDERAQAVDLAYERIVARTERKVQQLAQRLDGVDGRLVALDPKQVLKRGYTLVTAEDGTLIISAPVARQADRLLVHFGDGVVPVTPEETA
jgi:exodeoxyribonuclease VII large subunit